MEIILIAQTKDGEIFHLQNKLSRQSLRTLRTRKQFYCPQCKEEVLLKVGEINVPHFAHLKESTCRSLFAEGESALHIAGKQQLYEFFIKETHATIQLEPYFPHLKQRPDLFLSTKKEQIPIEFQCSRIPPKDIDRRTKGYLKAKMLPIWILQTPQQVQQLPQGITAYSFSRFELKFFQVPHTENPYILTYNAYTKTFHYLSSLLHLSGHKFIVNHRTLSIDHQCFPFAQPNKLTREELESYYMYYMKRRLTFLQQRIFFNRKGINDSFLRECYELKLIPSELPAWIGIPVTMQYFEGEHACEWQVSLLHFLSKKQMKFYEIEDEDLFEFAYTSNRLTTQVISILKAYVSFLLALGIKSISSQMPDVSQDEVKAVTLQYLQSEMGIEKI